MNATSKHGPEWSHVKIVRHELKSDGSKLGDPEVECLECGHQFRAGVSRIRAHLLGTGLGVAACNSISGKKC